MEHRRTTYHSRSLAVGLGGCSSPHRLAESEESLCRAADSENRNLKRWAAGFRKSCLWKEMWFEHAEIVGQASKGPAQYETSPVLELEYVESDCPLMIPRLSS